MLKRLKTVSMMLFLMGASAGAAYAASPAGVDDVKITQQNETATGVVKDAMGESVIGASVVVKGTTNGTITDFEGNFSIPNVKKGDIIEISFVGYKTQEIVWQGKSLNIVLKDDTQALEEVVVVGFGSQKKADLTGAVSQVKMDEVLGDRPVINASAALQGAMPGLMVSGSSSPGQSKSFNIRGDLSINGGSPLVLIDNVEGDLSSLNPDDIESVSVLKDAASSAIYGARAACGVILVTTKRPKNDAKFQFNYSFNQGWEKSIGRPKQASLEDYIAAYEEAGYSSQYWAGDGQVSTWKELLQQYKAGTLEGVLDNGIYQHTDGKIYYLKEGDPQGNALDTGILSNHNVSVSGGTDKLRFRISGNYSYENGPMITNKDKYTRKALSAFISADIAKWFTQEITMYYTDTKRSALSNNIRDPFATRLISWYPEGYMPGEILGTSEDYIIDSPRNSYLISPTSTTRNSTPRIQIKSIIKPLKNWDIVAEYTFNKNSYKYNNYSGLMQYADVQLAVKKLPTSGIDTYTINSSETKYNALNLYSTYKLELGKHKASVMVGFNQESSWYGYLNTSIDEQSVPTVPSFGGGTGTKNISEGYTEYAIRGAFGRLTYSFEDKYLLTANMRYDGSSKFPKENRFGFFPSVSVGWRLGQEKFMDWSREYLDDFKLRASYGSIGNQNIGAYGYIASMGIYQTSSWLDGDDKVTYISVPGLVRANYTWETVTTLDIGFDLNMFGNRLNAVFDWYKRDTKDMLDSGVELPSTVGTSAPLQNVANMSTTGWELAVTWRDKIGDWNYNVGFNVYDHMSEITKINNESNNLGASWYNGKEFGEIWGYVSDGYYTIDDFDLEKAKVGTWVLKEGVPSINGYTVQPGDEKFKDLDGNGVIDTGANTLDKPGDRKIIGNSTQRFQFGANLGVGYKGFDLSIMLQGVGKRDVALGGHALFPFGAAGADGVFHPVYSNQTDYWQAISYDPEDPNYMVAKNPNAKLFRIYGQQTNAGSNARTSTKYLQDGSYMRIKNATLSYTFPTEWIQKIHLNQLRLYVSVENLATFTSLPDGYDPESLSWSYPFYRTWSVGANISF
ncbi:MAG: TonB-dependent receptor [Bacteroidaceae bacterium]|nr:TonB-dependent receptor [Bacteroidaceae bacterium]